MSKKIKILFELSRKFLPKIITLLSIGAFIDRVMTSQNADTILDQYLFEPILMQFDRIK